MSQNYRQTRTRKPNPWAPLFGFIVMVVFGGFAWVITPQVRPYVERFLTFPPEWPLWAGNAVVAFVIFIVLFAIAMLIIGALGGRLGDPRDVRDPAKKVRQDLLERTRRRH